MPTSTDLTPTRTETITGMVGEYEAFAALVASLSEAEWARPSRCEGFDVRDVAGHVIGLAEDLVLGTPGSRTSHEEAASVRGDSPAQAAARLVAAVGALAPLAAALDDDDVWDAPSPAAGLTMAEGVLTLWYDTYVHAEDILDAVGRTRDIGPGERACLAYLGAELAKRGFAPSRFAFADRAYPALEVGAVDASTPAQRVGAHEFILAATGRLDARSIGLDPAVNIYAD